MVRAKRMLSTESLVSCATDAGSCVFMYGGKRDVSCLQHEFEGARATRRQRLESFDSTCSVGEEFTCHGERIPKSVGKTPPRDMKRLRPGLKYTILRVCKWSEKPALFLTNSTDKKGDGFYRPPPSFCNHTYRMGDVIVLTRVGYSKSRNKIALEISVNTTPQSRCLETCDLVVKGGCCTRSISFEQTIVPEEFEENDLRPSTTKPEVESPCCGQAFTLPPAVGTQPYYPCKGSLLFNNKDDIQIMGFDWTYHQAAQDILQQQQKQLNSLLAVLSSSTTTF